MSVFILLLRGEDIAGVHETLDAAKNSINELPFVVDDFVQIEEWEIGAHIFKNVWIKNNSNKEWVQNVKEEDYK